MQNTLQTVSAQTEQITHTTCCIVGSGPAGAVLALLLARQGISVLLLEEHMNFDREFRGDTIHPSVLQIMDEIGLADRLLALPHTNIEAIPVQTTSGSFTLADFHHLKTRYPYIALIPQVDFLNFITAEARKYPGFQLVMGARVEKLVEEDGIVRGVQYRGQDGWHTVHAALTVACDGRFSRMRRLAYMAPVKTSAPMDVLWFRLPMKPGEPASTGGLLGHGHILVMLNRGDAWQVGYVIPKGGYQKIRVAGLDALRQELVRLKPEWADRMDTLKEWKQISVLSVESSRLRHWYRPGLLFIGDAAHVMTPIGGVGINYAIQDAVVAANVLSTPLKSGSVSEGDLARVQRQRELPTRVIQRFQNMIQQRVLPGVMAGEPVPISPVVVFLLRLPFIRNLPARLIGLGLLPIHVKQQEHNITFN